jgi:hypothetical protein
MIVRIYGLKWSIVRENSQVTEGSSTGQDSLLEIPPHETVLVRYNAYAPAVIEEWKSQGVQEVEVAAGGREQRYADAEWHLDETSSPVISGHAVKLRL